MVVLVDNYDSFVHNLARYVRELGYATIVLRNDAVSVEEAAALQASHVIISPGPGGPLDAGISNDLVRQLGPTTPILGVCLGLQCISHVFGGEVVRAERPLHGKTSAIHHGGGGLFASIPSPFAGARYHSLIVPQDSLPSELEVLATDSVGEVMALKHRTFPIWGVQFHPESVLTEHGHALLGNFLSSI